MTMTQVEKRLAAIEREIGNLRQSLEYQQTVEGIRRGLESVARGEGENVRKVFARIRRKQSVRKPAHLPPN